MKQKIYTIVFIVSVIAIALLPLFFYLSKAAKNPGEFKYQQKNYATIEIKVSDISPEVLSLVKAGDIQKDYNGEENARIVSISRTEPQVAGKIAFNGADYIDFISGKKDLYAALRIRYDEVGDKIVLHPTTTMLKVGNRILFEFDDYFLNGEVIKISK